MILSFLCWFSYFIVKAFFCKLTYYEVVWKGGIKMNNIMQLCIKEVSIGNISDIIVWIGTGILLVAGVVALMKKPK